MKNQQGFTLIELIVVIVILGILAATAMPKFLDVQKDARLASLKGAAGAIQSASSLAHAAQLVAGGASNLPVTLEGVSIAMANGFPTSTSVLTAANMSTTTDSNYTVTLGPPLVISPVGAGTPGTCSFTWTPGTGITTPPPTTSASC